MKKKQHNAGDGGLRPPSPILSKDGYVPACDPETMRVRIRRQGISRYGSLDVGQCMMVPVGVGQVWIASGVAEEDKMLDSAPEVK